MALLIAVVSIIAITLIVHALNQALIKTICPICAGVFLTWLWMIVANILGSNFDVLVIAIMLGGSLVGITSALERNKVGGLLFKTLFTVVGFGTVYYLLYSNWLLFVLGVLLLFLIYLFFNGNMRKEKYEGRRVREIKNNLKNCC